MAERQDKVRLTLRLRGTLPPDDELLVLMGTPPSSSTRRGVPVLGGQLTQPVDVWNLRLTDWWRGAPSIETTAHVEAILHSLTPGLLALDRTTCHAEIYASTTFYDYSSILPLPTQIISAMATAQLDFSVALICVSPENLETPATNRDSRADIIRVVQGKGLAIQFHGELLALEELSRLSGAQRVNIVHEFNVTHDDHGRPSSYVYEIALTPSEQWEEGRLAPSSVLQAVNGIERLRPGLATLDRLRTKAKLRVVFTSHDDWGGFTIPTKLFKAVSNAGLEMTFVLLCACDDDDTDSSGDDDM